jgi:DHA1 family inner membrane transport protein
MTFRTRRGPDQIPVALSLLALALGGFAIGTTEFATMGVLPDISRSLGTSIPASGHLISLYALGVVVGAPLFAIFGARLPRKTLLLALMSAIAAGNLASALAPTFSTLAAARFVSGLPHGAFFGIGSVVAASLAPPERRARAVSMMMLGLTVANVAGVPVSTLLGQSFGWRITYVLVTVVAVATVGAILLWIPALPAQSAAAMRRELGAFRRLQVWLALLTGAVGFGGFFAVYSYIAPTMTDVAGFSPAGISIILALFGLGMTLGNLVGGRLADVSVMGTIYVAQASVIVVLVGFTFAAHNAVTAAIAVFLLGATGSATVPALQTRLMDVSADAQSLAAALNHSALNIANALGAWLGGLVIAAGYGYTSTAWVGAGLAVCGLAIATSSGLIDRRGRGRTVASADVADCEEDRDRGLGGTATQGRQAA